VGLSSTLLYFLSSSQYEWKLVTTNASSVNKLPLVTEILRLVKYSGGGAEDKPAGPYGVGYSAPRHLASLF
jgi:hypothetical protein